MIIIKFFVHYSELKLTAFNIGEQLNVSKMEMRLISENKRLKYVY